MTTSQILFSFRGRISRETFGRYFLGIPALIGLFVGIIDVMVGAEGELAFVLSLLFSALYLWPNLALQAKRWHDRGKSAWWILIMFVPVIGFIWIMAELVCLKGTDGPNEYGEEPLISTSGTDEIVRMPLSTEVQQSVSAAHLQIGDRQSESPMVVKLREALQLNEQGLITDDEYTELRQSILNGM